MQHSRIRLTRSCAQSGRRCSFSRIWTGPRRSCEGSFPAAFPPPLWNDERYAAHYAETASARKSRTQIRFDLQKKGLSRELIDRALEGLETADEKPLIRSLIGKKLRTGRTDDPRLLEKAAAACARKGFSASDIRAVISEYKEDMTEDLP